jgi:hypothetical protein
LLTFSWYSILLLAVTRIENLEKSNQGPAVEKTTLRTDSVFLSDNSPRLSLSLRIFSRTIQPQYVGLLKFQKKENLTNAKAHL